QDIMDTGLALVLTRALDRIEELVRALGDALAARADEHRATVMVGRTHAQPAVPISFGGKLAVVVAEVARHLAPLRAARSRGASSTMPQKANPIESETIVGLSILASQQVPALLAAMQPGHERAAGEWQAEWDAAPLVAAAAGGALAAAVRLVEGLQVFPDRMRANLELDGGLVMGAALM